MTRIVRCSLLIIASLTASVAVAAQTASDGPSRSINDTNAAVKKAYSDGKLDLGAAFDVEMKATVGKDGKLDPATITYTRSEGDAGTTQFIKDYVLGVNETDLFRYVGDVGLREVVVRVRQDASTFGASLTSEAASSLRAVTLRSMLSLMVEMARRDKSRLESPSEADRRDLTLLNGTTVSTSGRSVIVALELPKATFREMVEKELKK